MEPSKTTGGEFFRVDGSPYVGLYYYNNSRPYVYNPLSKIQEELYTAREFSVKIVKLRQDIKGGAQAPMAVIPVLTEADYLVGFIKRYFVQKRVNPRNTIVEINQEQFQGYGAEESNNTLNSKIYNALNINWVIAGAPYFVIQANYATVLTAEYTFPGISTFLKSPLQFYRRFG